MPRKKDAPIPTIEELMKDAKDSITVQTAISFLPSEFEAEFKKARLITLTGNDLKLNYDNANFGKDSDPIGTVREYVRYVFRKVEKLTIPPRAVREGKIASDPTYAWMVGKFIGDDAWRMGVLFDEYVELRSQLMNKIPILIMDGTIKEVSQVATYMAEQDTAIRESALEAARTKVRRTRGAKNADATIDTDDGDSEEEEEEEDND